jgi:hypothetical protein
MFDRAVRSKLEGVNGRASQLPEDPPGPARACRRPDVIVFGQIARDQLTLLAESMA